MKCEKTYIKESDKKRKIILYLGKKEQLNIIQHKSIFYSTFKVIYSKI